MPGLESERMTAAQTMLERIRERPYEGIRHGIKDKGNQQRGPRISSGKTQHRVVVEKQKGGEAGVLDALSDLSDSVIGLEGDG
jgi:hypothetical protein